ncbi:hypothetical protein HPB48_014414 [Haemaphysalis longicornis]|uniref:RING-CH-type domain-containing protein n=1 Tax=Haemaphysalis longicornis TaxID=44386 RepID=A0A9J6FA74_HAELO|nr:hypothetical protein HPB48_014414 [Haemaphysalis longicornis]
MDGSGEGNLDGVGVEERPDLLDDGAGVAAVLEGDGGESARSTAGSSASSAEPPRQEEFGARPVWEECRFCLGERAEAEGRLFSSPCLCRSTLVHRYCIQERINRGQGECPWCHAAYPVRVHSKPLWKWFWEKETRAVASSSS